MRSPFVWNFKVGDRVRSVKIGTRAEFEGDIVKRVAGGAFHVRDAEGELWHRNMCELTLIYGVRENGRR